MKNSLRKTISTLALIAMAATFSVASAPSWAELSQREAHEITILCEQLLADYAVYRDHMDADGFASIFTDDAELYIGGGVHVGREAYKKYIDDHGYPAKAHMIMITSTEITAKSETEANGVAYAVVLGSQTHVGPGDPPVQAEGIGAANEYHVDFSKTDRGWKISGLKLRGLFTGPR